MNSPAFSPVFFSDLRFALRQLRKTPAFTLSVVLTLALGIGATTAIFSLVNAVLLAPLPFPHPDRLMAITAMQQETSAGPAILPDDSSYAGFLDWRAQNHSFSSMGTFDSKKFLLNRSDGSAEQVDGGVVSGDSFRTLGVAPILGRDFARTDEAKGNHNVLLSYALWQSSFAGANDVIGKSLQLSGESWTIIGVMPKHLAFPITDPDPPFWVTFGNEDTGPNSEVEQRGWRDLQTIVGRLKPGVSREQAAAEMTSIQRGIVRQHVKEDKLVTAVRVRPGLEDWVGSRARPLRLLFGAVCCLLLIACTNVAGMLLTRTASRSGELAVRTALGASRWRVMRQLLLEFALLAIAGSALGASLASLALRVSLTSLPNVPRMDQASVSGLVLLFAFALAAITTLLFGAIPAWRAAQADPATLLQGGLRRNTPGRHQHRLHAVLVIGETALSLVLLVGAGLLIRSFDRAMHSDLGFRPDHLLTFRAFLPVQEKPAQIMQFHDALETRLRAAPGVEAVDGSFGMPFSGGDMTLNIDIDGRPTSPGEGPSSRVSLARADYLKLMEIPLIRGRWFIPAEDTLQSTSQVAVINQAFARKFFPGQDPIGRTFTGGVVSPLAAPGTPEAHRRIVGIIGDTRRRSQTEDLQPEYFLPWGQVPVGLLTIGVRTQGDPNAMLETARRTVNQLAPGTPLYRVRTMDEAIRRTNRDQRFQASLMTGFSVVSLLLAAVGIYGLLSYLVAQRTVEFGVRLALGAQPGDVLSLVLKRGLNLTLIGLAVGALVAYLLSARIQSVLYQTAPGDPLVYGAMAALLLAVAALASWLPARRAAKLEPVEVLRRQ
jgi:putative ABC transport system permease protein